MDGDAAGRREAGSARLVLSRERPRKGWQHEASPQARQRDAREWLPVVRGDIHFAHRWQHPQQGLPRVRSCCKLGGTAERLSLETRFFVRFFFVFFCIVVLFCVLVLVVFE